LLFQNLIGNAIKFKSNAPPVVNISVSRLDDYYEIAIKDNGIGFKMEYAERIFIIFQRLHARSKFEGTGIGLATCKRIVERHGGSIRVDSAPGEGSTFVITLQAGDK
jgi:chemotaxis family two-component system sensor kinase Cph1